jgi:hypothetical protein
MKKPNNKNALSHGIYARDFVLPWESEDDYMKHYQEIRGHYEPVGPPQEQVVRDLAQLFWKKRRLNISSQLAYAQHPNAPAMAEAGRGGWEGLGQYLQKTSGDTARLSIDARKAAQASSSTLVFLSQMIQSKILEQSVSPPPTEPEPTEAEQKARTEAWLRSIYEQVQASAASSSQPSAAENTANNMAKDSEPLPPSQPVEDWLNFERLNVLLIQLTQANKTAITMLQYAEEHDLEQGPFERAYRPEIMERDLKLEAMLDKQIDKAMQRLVNQKEYDRMYRQSAAPIEILPPQAEDATPPGSAPNGYERPQKWLATK